MRLKPHKGRSKRPHRLDAEIAKVELELYRLRGIRHSELSAEARRDPIQRMKASAGIKKAWKDPDYRQRAGAAMAKAWTPERRKAQAKKMRALWKDKAKRADMRAAIAAKKRTPEYRARAREKSLAAIERKRAADSARQQRPPSDALERAIFGGGS